MARFLPCTACVFLCCLLFPGRAPADLVVSKDGAVWGGTVHRRGGSNPELLVETLEGVVRVPRSAVKRVHPRRELLPLFRKFRARLDPAKERDLLLLARWCRDHGLYEEMFDLYDRLEVLHPEASGFHAFVNAMSRRIRYGPFQSGKVYTREEGKALLEAAAGHGPTRERIAETLIGAQPPAVREAVLETGLDSRKERVRCFAARLAGRFTPESCLEALVRLALLDRKPVVRKAARSALARYDRDGILSPFVRALRSSNRAVRMNALEALALFRDPRSVPVLVANLGPSARAGAPRRANVYVGNVVSAVTGFDGRVASGAAAAEPKVTNILEGALLDAGILSTRGGRAMIRADERRRITAVLSSIAGVDYGDDYLLWKGWWEQNRDRFLEDRERREQP